MLIHARDSHLPPPASVETSDPMGQAVASQRTPLVWVLDDDPAVGLGIRMLLESAGWRSGTSSSVDAFLRVLHTEQLDCLVLDLLMPGKSGSELLAVLPRLARRLPVVVVTAFPEQAPGSGPGRTVRAVLRKPFEGSRLLEEIRKAID